MWQAAAWQLAERMMRRDAWYWLLSMKVLIDVIVGTF